MAIEVIATSFDKFVSQFGEEAIDAVAKVAKEKLDVAAEIAKKTAPKDTGLLAKSIKTKTKKYKKKNGGKACYIGLGVESVWVTDKKGKKRNPAKYAHLVERGTKKSAPKPFMRKALADVGGIRTIEGEIEKEVRQTVLQCADETANQK